MGVASNIRRFFTRSRQPRPPLDESPAHPLRGAYDAARDDPDMAYHWGRADALDADAANSLEVRTRLRKRARLEYANNSHVNGITKTHANYVIGTGPKLRFQSRSPGFNSMVEAAWNRWCKATGFVAKLRTMRMTKVTDGEVFGLLTEDQAVRDLVKLNVRPIECDQVTTPHIPYGESNYVDGIKLDENGHPLWYDILPQHPGASAYIASQTADRVLAQFVVHWFSAERPGQHRGVPELTSSMTSSAQSRRYREAVIASAELVAKLSVVMQMGIPNDGADEVTPFSTMPIEKGMFVASPGGAEIHQIRAEQPSTTYEMFDRLIYRDEARPLNMPFNIAAADSSGYSFSGGRLDHLTYFVAVDVDRLGGEEAVVDRVFTAWFTEAVIAYGWVWDTDAVVAPRRIWGWDARPQIDDLKTAKARQTALETGQTDLSRIHGEDGKDFEDTVVVMANTYGKTVEEMREALFKQIFSGASSVEPEEDEDEDDEDDDDDDQQKPVKGFVSGANGHHRFAELATQ